jgi:EmrB/QacA subfamily drug resistance transporter
MTDTSSTRVDPHVMKVAGVLIVGALAVVFDTTIVSVALHTLSTDLHAPVSTIQWVTTGYLLALGMTVPLSAWAYGRFGGKRLWMLALAIFLIGSIASSLAWDAPSLIAFRVIQGVGGGLMLPLLQTLIVAAAGGKLLGRTIAVVALPALLGPILGPLAGGLILTAFDWRWMFWVNVPFCIAGLVLAWRLLPKDAPGTGSRLDVAGLLMLSPGIAGVMIGLSNVAGTDGFWRPWVLVPLVAGVVLLAAFGVYAARKRSPLVDIRLLRHRSLGSASAVLFLSGFALYGAMLLLPLFWQQVRGVDALTAGLMLVPQGVGTLFSRTLAGRLTDGIGARWVTVGGFVIVALSTLPFTVADASTSDFVLVAALLVRGFGLGAVTIPVMTVSYLGLEKQEIAHSSVITRLTQQVGGAFGSAVLAVVLQAALTANVPRGASGIADAYDQAFWWSIAFTVLAVALSFALPGRPRASASPASASPASATAPLPAPTRAPR